MFIVAGDAVIVMVLLSTKFRVACKIAWALSFMINPVCIVPAIKIPMSYKQIF